MTIYLDGLRRCDNCLHELGTALAIPCKGETAYRCQKAEMCLGCAGKQQGWCDKCFQSECLWLFGEDGEDEDDEYVDYEMTNEEKTRADEVRLLVQWNKMAQA